MKFEQAGVAVALNSLIIGGNYLWARDFVVFVPDVHPIFPLCAFNRFGVFPKVGFEQGGNFLVLNHLGQIPVDFIGPIVHAEKHDEQIRFSVGVLAGEVCPAGHFG